MTKSCTLFFLTPSILFFSNAHTQKANPKHTLKVEMSQVILTSATAVRLECGNVCASSQWSAKAVLLLGFPTQEGLVLPLQIFGEWMNLISAVL